MLLFALTPSGSSSLLVLFRGLVGFTQVVICIYSPLWTDSHAPSQTRATWMSYLQASVPLGVMSGYVLATASLWLSDRSRQCPLFACWRWPFVIQVVLVTPLIAGLFFVPDNDIALDDGVAKGICEKHPLPGPMPAEYIINKVTDHDHDTSVDSSINDTAFDSRAPFSPSTTQQTYGSLNYTDSIAPPPTSSEGSPLLSSGKSLQPPPPPVSSKQKSTTAATSLFSPYKSSTLMNETFDSFSDLRSLGEIGRGSQGWSEGIARYYTTVLHN
jgi:hypothetical protein